MRSDDGQFAHVYNRETCMDYLGVFLKSYCLPALEYIRTSRIIYSMVSSM